MRKLTKYNSFEELKRQAVGEQHQTSAVAFEKLIELLRKYLAKKNSNGERAA